MNEATVDERYVTYREHSELRDEVTALKNRLAHVPDKLERIDAKLTEIALTMARTAAVPVQAASSFDGLSLAIQRSLDAATRQPSAKGPGWSLVIALGMVALLAGYKAVFG